MDDEHFWTDSNVVLGYIGNEARRFHTFVANRVQRIHFSTNPISGITSQQNLTLLIMHPEVLELMNFFILSGLLALISYVKGRLHFLRMVFWN